MARKESGLGLQDVVYNLDVGMGLNILRAALYIGAVLVLVLLYTATQFKGLKDADAMDSAQLGRNLAYGRGYTTYNISPLSMKYMQGVTHGDPKVLSHPELTRPPVYPAVLAGVFKLRKSLLVSAPTRGMSVYKPEQYFIIPLNNMFSLFTGLLVYLLGMRLFDKRLGFLAMSIFFLSNVVWASSVSGTDLPLVTFLSVAAFYSIVLSADTRDAGYPFIKWFLPYLFAAGFCVIAFLTRYGTVFLMPALAFYVRIRFKEKRWLLTVLFIGLFLAGIAPWLARNFMLCGKLLGLAPYMVFDDDGMLLSKFEASLSVGQFFKGAFFRLWLKNMAGFYNSDIRQIGAGFMGAFFLVSFFYSFVRAEVRSLRWSVALGILLAIILAGFAGKSAIKLLHVFLPFVIIYGLAFFFLLLERLQLKFRLLELALISFVVIMSAMPLVFVMLPPRTGFPYPPYHPPFIASVSSWMQPTEIICTDMPWATAWYGDQVSLLLPSDIDEFYKINDLTYKISAIYFTTITRDKPFVRTLMIGRYRSWFPVLNGNIPGDFPLSSAQRLNHYDQLFLTDYPRWEKDLVPK